ncbi:MAG: Sec-dependent nitrous-oxide reductase [Fimbriimonadia bacterium]|nr:Sec-dependent nitrous-oxide reductase [Fimbriimonadia bacterium]
MLKSNWIRYTIVAGILLLFAVMLMLMRGGGKNAMVSGLPNEAMEIARSRELSPDDVYAALATYMPTGRPDEYLMFASGGHSGQLLVIGVPSMRLLKTVAVFTPEPWQGYGYGVMENPLQEKYPDSAYPPADTHHPALSETNGEYDGEFAFIGDKTNGRVAVVDLRDFETKQILSNPVINNNHGAAFVTPNTEYVVEVSQYGVPLGNKYVPIEKYKEEYRGLVTFWKFDRKKGRLIPDQSFSIELPPYWQDLADCGKLASDGWVFINSFNTELATGGMEKGNPPFEAGTAENDMDYMHLINWKKAEELISSGKFQKINNFRVISLKDASESGVLYFAPEPKSPHGVDICPCGEHIVVGGKLDPHVTIFGMSKIKQAIEAKDFEGKDVYGVPILKFDAAKVAQVEVGLGPLHTQFDDQGYAYTSLFLDSAVARWSMGDCKFKAPEGDWKMISKIQTHYNIGHLAAVEGDTVKPSGKMLVALNKWSMDRFTNVGPLLPQNLQLIDINNTGESMRLLYDMPLGVGEPHYAQIMKAERLKAFEVYPEIGWNAHTQTQVDPKFAGGKGTVVVKGNTVEIYTPLIRSHFDPEHIEVKKGQKVIWKLTNLERTRDTTHGLTVAGYRIGASIEPGETVTFEFVADKEGVYPFYCSEFCSALHLEMMGYLFVKP